MQNQNNECLEKTETPSDKWIKDVQDFFFLGGDGGNVNIFEGKWVTPRSQPPPLGRP